MANSDDARPFRCDLLERPISPRVRRHKRVPPDSRRPSAGGGHGVKCVPHDARRMLAAGVLLIAVPVEPQTGSSPRTIRQFGSGSAAVRVAAYLLLSENLSATTAWGYWRASRCTCLSSVPRLHTRRCSSYVAVLHQVANPRHPTRKLGQNAFVERFKAQLSDRGAQHAPVAFGGGTGAHRHVRAM